MLFCYFSKKKEEMNKEQVKRTTKEQKKLEPNLNPARAQLGPNQRSTRAHLEPN